MFLNGLQLRVISPLALQLFGFLHSGKTGSAKGVDNLDRHEADALFRNNERTVGHSLCASTHLLSLGIGKHS